MPAGRPGPQKSVSLWVEYAQELKWLDGSQLEFRLPTPGTSLKAKIALDAPAAFSEVESSHELCESTRGFTLVDSCPSGDFVLRFRVRDGWPRPLLVTHQGHFLLSLRPPAGPPIEDDPLLRHWSRNSPSLWNLEWSDRGFGMDCPDAGRLTRVHRDRPLTLYGRHQGQGELELDGQIRNARWRAVLKAAACDNPAIRLLWARRRLEELDEPAESRRLALQYSLYSRYTQFAWDTEPEDPLDALARSVASQRVGVPCREELDRRLDDLVAWVGDDPVFLREVQLIRPEMRSNLPVLTRLEWLVRSLRRSGKGGRGGPHLQTWEGVRG